MHALDSPQVGERTVTSAHVRTHAHVTARTDPLYVVRVRTNEWPEHTAFISHIDRRRRQAGFATWQALSYATGISHTTISNWRSGKQRPSMDKLYPLAEALGEPDTAHSLAELAGIVDAERFGRAGPAVKRDEGEELILNSGASPAQIKRMLERYHRKLDASRREAIEDITEQLDLLRERDSG